MHNKKYSSTFGRLPVTEHNAFPPPESTKSMSLEELYRMYYPRLATYASFFLTNDEAHDAVQEVFLNLLEKNGKTFDATINAYLYRAVQNKCIDIIRRRTVRNQYASDMGKKMLQMEMEYLYTSRNEIEDLLQSKELREAIESAVKTLPPKGKEVFRLYFEHRKTAGEIGNILKISVSTVENHIYSCIKSLRKKLEFFYKNYKSE
ncbi:MAG: RNA polymerase sigma-70 factor [Bacteroidales bacterium]|jgi:RNA polymerase sigma-70 factor (ECF subfamily)|nr:RNA polymerase sigma-70 factor [Bacteroidales bacterium]